MKNNQNTQEFSKKENKEITLKIIKKAKEKGVDYTDDFFVKLIEKTIESITGMKSVDNQKPTVRSVMNKIYENADSKEPMSVVLNYSWLSFRQVVQLTIEEMFLEAK